MIAGGRPDGCFTAARAPRQALTTAPPAVTWGMVADLHNRQRITALTPLADVVAQIARVVEPAAPRLVAPPDALGATLAHDIAVTAPRPAVALALTDGFAVDSALTAFAEPYAPALLPDADEIAAGDALPAGADAVAPLAAVRWHDGGVEVLEPVAPDSGVLLPGADAGAGEVLWRAGHRPGPADVAVMQALGIGSAAVRRPRVAIARSREDDDAVIDAIVTFLAGAVAAAGGEAVPAAATTGIDAMFERVLGAGGADAAVVAGGTGAGARDASVHALRRTGAVAAHGIAIAPGETTAFGTAFAKPVLVVPGRLDAAVAAWLLVGRPLLARLAGAKAAEQAAVPGVLTAKVTSTIGIAELVLVRRDGDGVVPLAARTLPLAALAHACGFIVIPPASEGLAAGAAVAVEPLRLS